VVAFIHIQRTSSSPHDASPHRAIGIVRVSRVSGRDGERFVSPEEQRARIEDACARDGLTLLDVYKELDVSGGKTLAARPGLSAAVAAVEAGEAEVVAAAYFDRLFRSLSTQAEAIERIESAGGRSPWTSATSRTGPPGNGCQAR
jgi:DNA invertase Pin-like site-specific DNA recombinase